MKKVLLQGKGITKSFQSHGVVTTILNAVDVTIYEGDFTIIMGASGAGKSTLLYALSGMDDITGGSVEYQGAFISGLSENHMAKLRAKKFGFVFQQTHLVSNLTLLENVMVAGAVSGMYTPKEVQQKAEQLLNQMNIQEARNRIPVQVSGGEAQRAAIARAMIHEPGLLFADEPTGALNKSNTEEVLNLLSGLHDNGQSILMVTHDLRAAIRATRLLYLEDGKILSELELPVFRETEAKQREAQVNTWLSSLQW